MPSLTPEKLQAARRASGRLGGRPRKPTRDEAREEALERLLPKALAVLAAHLGEGEEINAGSWRAALRVFEYAYGGPAAEETASVDTRGVAEMDPAERDELRQALLANYPHLRRTAEAAPTSGASALTDGS